MSNRTHEMFLVAQRFNIETPQDLERALERARVVGVLAAWATRTGVEPVVYRSLSKPGLWCCDCDGLSDPDARRCFYGETRDAARAAAVESIEAGEV